MKRLILVLTVMANAINCMESACMIDGKQVDFNGFFKVPTRPFLPGQIVATNKKGDYLMQHGNDVMGRPAGPKISFFKYDSFSTTFSYVSAYTLIRASINPAGTECALLYKQPRGEKSIVRLGSGLGEIIKCESFSSQHRLEYFGYDPNGTFIVLWE